MAQIAPINVTITDSTTNLPVVRSAGAVAELRAFERAYGELNGEREIRSFPITTEVRDSGAGPEMFTISGHASVFNRESLDLGGFVEFIAPEAFTEALSDPNLKVHATWSHSDLHVLGATPKTLDLVQDEIGLRYWVRVIPTTYSADLRSLMEAGAIDEASFAFSVDDDEWRIDTAENGDETVVRTINRIGTLFDVTICARGAYPQATSEIVRTHILQHARSHGAEEPRTEIDEIETDMRNLALVKARTRVKLARR